MVYFKDGAILFNGGKIAMAESCCDCSVPCNYVNNPIPNLCVECAATDHPHGVFSPSRTWKASISGVTVGTNTGCGVYYSPSGQDYLSYIYAIDNCEQTVVADHTDFFNGDFFLDTCDTIVQSECRYLGCSEPYIEFTPGSGIGPWHLLEVNYLQIGTYFESNKWKCRFQLESYVVGVLADEGTSEADLCAQYYESGAYFIYSVKKRTVVLSRAIPTFEQYSNDETLAPPETCELNVLTTVYGACIPAAWALSLESSVNPTPNTSCKKALDFTGATFSAESV